MRKNFGVKPWFYPLPVLIIGTYDENGQPNAMNAAWGGLYESNMVELCLDQEHKTTKNILLNRAFTISFADEDHVAACDYVGLVSANHTPNKFQKVGFSAVKSSFVNAPIIEELPLTLECSLVRVTSEGNILGKIMNISADESILGEDGLIDAKKLKPISYDPVHHDYLALGESVGKAFQIGNQVK